MAPKRIDDSSQRKIAVTITVRYADLDAIDEAAQKAGTSRSEWLAQAARERLDRET